MLVSPGQMHRQPVCYPGRSAQPLLHSWTLETTPYALGTKEHIKSIICLTFPVMPMAIVRFLGTSLPNHLTLRWKHSSGTRHLHSCSAPREIV